MIDFSKVEKAIIDDMKIICVNNYLILNNINILPKEVNFIIAYNRFLISEELKQLYKDIKHSYYLNFRTLIDTTGIDILSEYSIYFENLPKICYDDCSDLDKYIKHESHLKDCINLLFSLNKNCFYELIFKNMNESYKIYEK